MAPDSQTPVELIVAAYDWAPGRCFRCQRENVETAAVGHLPAAEVGAIRACATDTLVMERAREAAADRYGWPYQPGTPTPVGR
jgi:hypothetical protein